MPRAQVFTASDGTRIPMVPPPICRFCSDPIAEEWGRYRQCGKCTNRLKALARAATVGAGTSRRASLPGGVPPGSPSARIEFPPAHLLHLLSEIHDKPDRLVFGWNEFQPQSKRAS